MAIKVYKYTDDAGEELSVRMGEELAAIGGFSAGDSSGVMGATPLHRVRGIYAVNQTTGRRLFVPMATQDESRYSTKTRVEFQYKDQVYTSISSRGEKRLHGASNTAANP